MNILLSEPVPKHEKSFGTDLRKSSLKPTFPLKSKVVGLAELVSPKLKFWTALSDKRYQITDKR
jgi:hypothetical protein